MGLLLERLTYLVEVSVALSRQGRDVIMQKSNQDESVTIL